jgi:outer membrane protein assembly factor BamB
MPIASGGGRKLLIGLTLIGLVALGAALWLNISRAMVASDDASQVSAPAPASLAGKMVYLGTDGGVYALDARTGARRWRYPAPGAARLRVTSMALGDETLYAATMNGLMLALRARDGKLLWSSNVVHESNAPTVAYANGVVYAAAHLGTPQEESDRLLFALRAHDGHELWRFVADEPILSAPAFGAGTVFFGTTDRLLYAVDARSGTLRWKSQTYSGSGGGAALESYTHARPVGIAILVRGETVFVNAKIKHWNDAGKSYIEPDTYIRSVNDPTGGRTGTPPENFPTVYPPVISQGVSYAEGGGGLWAASLEPQRVQEEWFHRSDGTQYTGPAIGEQRVYICAFNGYTYGLSQKDGHEVWRARTGGGELSQPPAFAGGAVFVSGASAAYALRASDGARIWRLSLGKDTIRLTPLVA